MSILEHAHGDVYWHDSCNTLASSEHLTIHLWRLQEVKPHAQREEFALEANPFRK